MTYTETGGGIPLSATEEMLTVNGECPNNLYSTVFTLKDKPGILMDSLKPFAELGISMNYIESRPSKMSEGYDFYVEFICPEESKINDLTAKLESVASKVSLMTEGGRGNKVPWFPRKIRELDRFASRVLDVGKDLHSNHPGATDPVYRSRRREFADIAINYKYGEKIPYMKYEDFEIETWGIILTKLKILFPTHACREFNRVFPLLEQYCGYRPDNIPQLQDISDFLKECSGFTLRPVAGLLSARDFLAGLAFRVFHSTQYIRHSSQPIYTPEPDICHEIIGHVPLLANPAFAEFSQEIGLASLGASDEYVKKLATLYWFTVEFGMCRQDGELKAYGAGILSSYGELEYSTTDKPQHKALEIEEVVETEYPITEFQPLYFVSDDFEKAKLKVRKYAETIPRPFTVRYNPYTQCVELLDKKDKLIDLTSTIQGDLSLLRGALAKADIAT